MNDIRSALRAAFPLPIILVILVTPALPMAQAVRASTYVDLPDHLGAFASGMVSPSLLLLPLVVALLAGLPIASELRHRYVASRRMRIGIGRHLRLRLLAACAVGFVALFAYSFATFVLCFLVWPLIGDPGISTRGANGAAPSVQRYAFTSLLQLGELAYGVVYSMWLGLCGAIERRHRRRAAEQEVPRMLAGTAS